MMYASVYRKTADISTFAKIWHKNHYYAYILYVDFLYLEVIQQSSFRYVSV
jgi:hypothetical protein